MILLALLILLPLLFFPWRARTGSPAEAGERAFFLPRWTLLVLLVPLLAVPRLALLDLLLVALVITQTLRVPSTEASLRGAVWIAGIVIHATVATVIPVQWRYALVTWWWVPFAPVVLYAWSQHLWPNWDFPWLAGPVPVFDPTWVAGSANAAEVEEAFRKEAGLGSLPPAFATDPAGPFHVPSTMGGPHYLAEILAAVAVSAPTFVTLAAMGTMVMLGERLPLLIAAGVYALMWIMGPKVGTKPWQGAVLFVLMLLFGLVVWWRLKTNPTFGPRVEIWRRTLALIRAHPWLGVGTSAYRLHVEQAALPGERPWITRLRTAHSEYLERAAEWGIPGALLFMAWTVTAAGWRPAPLALALGAVAGHSFAHPVGWFLFCLLGGL